MENKISMTTGLLVGGLIALVAFGLKNSPDDVTSSRKSPYKTKFPYKPLQYYPGRQKGAKYKETAIGWSTLGTQPKLSPELEKSVLDMFPAEAREFFKMVLYRESGGYPGGQLLNEKEDSRGLFGINTISDTVMKNLGVTNKDFLFLPMYNAKIARKLYDMHGTKPWRLPT